MVLSMVFVPPSFSGACEPGKDKRSLAFPYQNGINLVQGGRYYIEAIQHEGGGEDNLAATFKLIGAAAPVDGEPSAFVPAVIEHAEAVVVTPRPMAG